jgi:DNA-directed RNA polymerase specialized sigma subunit
VAQFRIDVPQWLRTLRGKMSKVVRWSLLTVPGKEIAKRLRISQGRVSQIRREAIDDYDNYTS